MKLITLLITILFSGSALAFLDPGPGTKITPIENVKYQCADSGGGFAINIGDERVWQTDGKADVQGLELIVTDFRVNRCPHCYNIAGEIVFFGEKLIYQLFLKRKNGSDDKATLNVAIGDGEESVSINYECDIL